MEKELSRSRQIIEEITGREVRDLAAPFGVSNSKVEKVLQKLQYRSSFGGKRGTNTLKGNPYDLRRVVVERFFTLQDFEKALSKWGIIRDKILGFFRKDILLFLIGEEKTERLRKKVYHSPLAFFLHPRLFFPTLLLMALIGAALFYLALAKIGLF
ncbi:MAG: polysaccharide deacetylase family protein [Planctomycetota bacterium]|nr:MAG: polysaccharide deacetylase family protein [Planctomycetota bacterium]